MAAHQPVGQPCTSQAAAAGGARNSGQTEPLGNTAGRVYAGLCEAGRRLARISQAAALAGLPPGFHALPPPASARG